MTVTEEEVNDLLEPVVDRFKRDARDAIVSAKADIKNILKVNYNSLPECRPEGMPAPRLQFRWEDADRWTCHYELVFPLREFDIRNDAKTNFAIVELGRTLSSGGGTAPWAREAADQRVPYRDGAHAQWDSAAFKGLPIFVIAPNGSFVEVPQKPEVQAFDLP